MAKKEENFDFDTEDKAKYKFDLSFLNNLTQKQRGIILIAAVAIVLVIAIIITCVVIGANGGFDGGNNTGNNGNNGGESVPDEMPDNVIGFYIATNPSKLNYDIGEEADYTGLSVYVNTAEGGEMLIEYVNDPEAFKITGFDSSKPEEAQRITVEVNGSTAFFVINIRDRETRDPAPVSIHFSTYPQQIFSVDDKFDYTGGVLTCTYDDGSTKDFPLLLDYMYGLGKIFDPSGKHILLPGDYVIEIEYGENGVFVQTEYTITVNP